jgi:hypothetical protein
MNGRGKHDIMTDIIEINSRVGRIEGKIEEGFSTITATLKRLPCSEQSSRIDKLERNVAGMRGSMGMKDKFMFMLLGAASGAIASGVVVVAMKVGGI